MPWFETHQAAGDAVRTVILLLLIFGTQFLVISRLRRSEGLTPEMRRRWASQVRIVSMLLLMLGLMLIWGTALKTFALSLVAIAAAIVIATKELIMCVSGSLLRTGGRSYKIGDRVEIGLFRGDVIDQTLLTTSLLEVGPGSAFHQHTGRLIVVPNSLLLTTSVVNESFTDDYVLHAFDVRVKAESDWREAESALLQAAREECGAYMADAQRHIKAMVTREGLEPLSVEPRVTLRLEDTETLTLLLRLPVPARRKGRIEQAVTRRYLTIRDQKRDTKHADSD